MLSISIKISEAGKIAAVLFNYTHASKPGK